MRNAIYNNYFFGFVVAGAYLLVHGAYLMSTVGFSLNAGDFKNLHWWGAIGLPLIVGCCYVSIGLKLKGNFQDHKILIIGCGVLSLVVLPINYFVSIIPATIIAAWFVIVGTKRNET